MENVWDYPRPPAVDTCPRRVCVELAGQILADSNRALRVLETSHPPTIYLPADNVRVELLLSGEEVEPREGPCPPPGNQCFPESGVGLGRM